MVEEGEGGGGGRGGWAGGEGVDGRTVRITGEGGTIFGGDEGEYE